MIGPGASRKQIARILNTAYADGLLSEDTFVHRLDQLLGASLIDRRRLVGDLNLRASGRGIRARLDAALSAATSRAASLISAPGEQESVLLGLDWSGAKHELLIGRHHDCDVVLSNPSVSRRHARVTFRDGGWILQDLESMNGTIVNGVRVGRCELRPGDRLLVGDERLQID